MLFRCRSDEVTKSSIRLRKPWRNREGWSTPRRWRVFHLYPAAKHVLECKSQIQFRLGTATTSTIPASASATTVTAATGISTAETAVAAPVETAGAVTATAIVAMTVGVATVSAGVKVARIGCGVVVIDEAGGRDEGAAGIGVRISAVSAAGARGFKGGPENDTDDGNGQGHAEDQDEGEAGAEDDGFHGCFYVVYTPLVFMGSMTRLEGVAMIIWRQNWNRQDAKSAKV
jgi:hypothetical protein